MKSSRILIVTLMSVMAFAFADAMTVSWAIYPKYDKLSRLTSSIFMFQQNGKWGAVTTADKPLFPAEYDFATPFVNGYSLIGKKTENKYTLSLIVSDDGKIKPVKGLLFLNSPIKDQFFSEGKLPVCDKSGKFGYIDTDGNLIISCRFDDALPFKQGYAPVRSGQFMHFITESYDENQYVLPVDFHYGDLTAASCFSNGEAIVAYNDDFAIIDLYGNRVKKISSLDEAERIYNEKMPAPSAGAQQFSTTNAYAVVQENGKAGLSHNNEIIVSPQFDSFAQEYGDGLLIACKDGKYGLLRVEEGDYSISMSAKSGAANKLDVGRRGEIESINLEMSIPATHNKHKLMVDCGNGKLQDFTAKMTISDTTANVFINPAPPANAETCKIRAVLENDGIVVAEASENFTLSYPIRLRVSAPGRDVIRANANNSAHFSSTVFNDSHKPVRVTATWSTGASQTQTIPAHGSKTFTTSIQVTENHVRNIRITLNTGESNSRKIYFEKYF